MGRFWKLAVAAMIQEAIAPTTVADKEEGAQEDQGADGAWLPLQQEAQEVEAHEHRVAEPQGWV